MSKRVPAGLLALALFAAAPGHLRAGDCGQTEGFYLANHYVVKDIKLEAPLDIFHFLMSAVNLDQLPLKAQKVVDGAIVEKGEFDNVAFATSQTVIRDQMMQRIGPNFRVEFVFVLAELRSCDDSAHTLEAVYRVYGFSVPAALAQSFNSQLSVPTQHSSTQHSSTTHPGSFLQSLSPQLTGGYDANRHFYAGGHAMYHGASGTPLSTVVLDGAGSSSSMVFQGELKGSRSWTRGPVEQAEWAIGYFASDLPSKAIQLQQSKFTGRFSASSHALFNQGLVLYFGGAVEAGNQHSNGAASSAPAVLLQSQLGNLKGYAGVAWAKGPNSLKASYGAQVGKSGPGVHEDYSKHVVHVADSLRLLPKDHHPLSIDFQFGAGWIQGDALAPLAERFFGGNLNRVFIPGDAWRIPDGPFIRSFPTNSLGLASPGAVGGTNFFSVNTTIAYALWGKPLVPQSILGEMGPALHGQLKSFESALTNVYIADLAEFKTVESNLSRHRPDLSDLRTKLAALKQRPGVSADISGQADNTLGDLDDVDASMAALGNRNAAVDPIQPMLSLVAGFPGVPPQLATIADDLKALVVLLGGAGMAAEQEDFRARETSLRTLQTDSLARYNAINQGSAKAKAKRDMQFPGSVLDQLLHALNIYSISPAILLDAARTGPQQGLGQAGVRYGAGPAVRLSLLNVDVTLGYSLNPRRQAGERRGAPVITLEFSDIFR